MSKEKRIHIVKSIIKHALLLCVGFFWIYPFLWMISASFKGQNEFFQNRLGLIPLVPTIDNFIRIWQKADFGTYFINTIIVTVFSVIIVLIMTMPWDVTNLLEEIFVWRYFWEALQFHW